MLVGSTCPSLTETVVPIGSTLDIVTARERGRSLASALGFAGSDLIVVAVAISELARNILEYAAAGEIVLDRDERSGLSGIVIVARDQGPGIPDVDRVLSAGCATGTGGGLGLIGMKRLMDELEITSAPGKGTMVTARKWRR